MLNIVLTRIDDRLIHGQVITAWAKITQGNRIIVVDDEIAEDPFMVKVLKMAAPSSIKVEIFTTHDAAVALQGEDTGERVIILVKNPSTVLGLVQGGVSINELNLGGMGAMQGRKQLYRNISISEDEKNTFKELIALGVNVFVQIVPDANKMPIDTLI